MKKLPTLKKDKRRKSKDRCQIENEKSDKKSPNSIGN